MQTQSKFGVVVRHCAVVAQVSAGGPNGGWSPAATSDANALTGGPNGGWITSAGPNGGW